MLPVSPIVDRVRRLRRLKPGRPLPHWLRRYARPLPIGWLEQIRRRLQSYNSITFVQSWTKAEATAVTTKQSAAAGSPTTTGNNIIVVAANSNGGSSLASVTDTPGNTYTKLRSQSDAIATNAVDIWYSLNITGSAGIANHKITANLGSSANVCFGAIEVTGNLATDGPGAGQGPAGSSTTPSTTSVTPATTSDLAVIGLALNIASNESITEPSTPGAFTSFVQEANTGISVMMDGAYLVLSSAAALNPSWTLSPGPSGYAAVIGLFKEVATAFPPPFAPRQPAIVFWGDHADQG